MEKLLLWLVSLFAPILRQQGIDFDRMISIVEVKLLMDKRRVYMNWGKSAKKESSNHLQNVLLFYALTGLLIGFMLYIIPSLLVGMVILHSYFLFMMAMTLITDFSTVLLDTTDNQIVMPKPLSSRTLFMARLVHIIIYLLQFTIALTIIPLAVCIYRYGFFTGIGMIFTILLTVMLAVFITYLIYLLILRFSNEEKVKEIVTYAQIFMTVFFAVGYQVIPRLIDLKSVLSEFTLHWYSYLLPPVWMALTLEMIYTVEADLIHLGMAFLSLFVPIGAFWFLNKYLAPSFAKRIASISGNVGGKQITSSKAMGSSTTLSAFFSPLLCRGPVERSAFEFTWKMTSRDKGFRLQFYPGLGYILVIVLIVLWRKGQGIEQLLEELPGTRAFLWLIYIPIISIAGSISYASFYENYQASWIFRSTPVHRPGTLITGGLKALFVKFFLPVYLVMFLLSFSIWKTTIIDDFLFGLFTNLLSFGLIASLSEHFIPFTRQPNVQQQSGRFMQVILQMLVVALMVGIHFLAIGYQLIIYILPIVFGVCLWLLVRYLQNIPWTKIKT